MQNIHKLCKTCMNLKRCGQDESVKFGLPGSHSQKCALYVQNFNPKRSQIDSKPLSTHKQGNIGGKVD